MKLEKTFQYANRASQVIAHQALTNSKRPECFVGGLTPTHITRAQGCYLWDVDGNRYVDFVCGLGTNLLGYANHEITKAAYAQMQKGTVYSVGSTIEVELAERLQAMFPCAERVRFLKTGSEACSAAVRIARAATGRSIVISDAYHGWADDFVSLTPPACGVPARDWMCGLSNSTMGMFDFVAAVIVEPIITDHSPARIEHLRWLRDVCDRSGAALIFDETITGLRFPGFSVSKWCGVEPDILIMGKALGGGFPLSMVGGRRKFMDADYFVSSTFAGETVAMAAAIKTLDLLTNETTIERLWNDGERFQEEFNAIAPDLIKIVGYPTRGVLQAKDDLTKALFMQETVKAGMLFGPSWFWCASHADESHNVLSLCRVVLKRIGQGEIKLEGEIPMKPFAQKVRGDEHD